MLRDAHRDPSEEGRSARAGAARRRRLLTSRKVENNTRELEGAITKLQGMSLLQNGIAIDLELAKAALGDIGLQPSRSASRSSRSSIASRSTTTCASATCRARSATRASRSRGRSACILARRHTRYSLEEIGGYFGGRDHTTVLHAVRTVDRDCKDDHNIARQITHIEGQIVGA